MDKTDAATELIDVMLDDLGPALQWYRDEVGRRLGLVPAEVVCLDLARRHGAALSSQVAERTGLTRSAVAKMLRRLERAGHLVRHAGRPGDPEVAIRALAHPERDAVLADLRRKLTRALAPIATVGAAHVLAQATQELHLRARAMGDAAAEKRRLEARRREREADPVTPWWAR